MTDQELVRIIRCILDDTATKADYDLFKRWCASSEDDLSPFLDIEETKNALFFRIKEDIKRNKNTRLN
ncbi:hypothetical protein [Pedobacter sp. MC2016-24]|uniref:hypothetical protein n=1 Tax=Pedobacter sp. MC2016-24 TaxID=2780090 RepID=UPI001880310F|nr:hypothetical protein [Pedobacter sp. MC2016-24]MBE9601239.1 hypothetical protein [Pedobacter sp. MC2016-24]